MFVTIAVQILANMGNYVIPCPNPIQMYVILAATLAFLQFTTGANYAIIIMHIHHWL